MKHKLFALLAILNSGFALSQGDQAAIQNIIVDYTDSWNTRGCKGFSENFSIDADFVNIFGMKFSGKAEIEARHLAILQSFFKDSKLEIVDTHLREAQPGLVIANIDWRLHGFRAPGSDMSLPVETREGIFTQVFLKSGQKWEIIASQNTLKMKR